MARVIYTTIIFSIRDILGISNSEYIFCDQVYKLSKDGWCKAKQAFLAKNLGISDRSIRSMAERMIKLGLIEQGATGKYKTTEKWYNTAVLEKAEETSTFENGKKLPMEAEETSYGKRKKLPMEAEETSLTKENKKKTNLKNKKEKSKKETPPNPPISEGKEIPVIPIEPKPIIFKHDELYENLINYYEAYPEKWGKLLFENRIESSKISEENQVTILKNFSRYRFSNDKKYDGSASLQSNIAQFETWLGWKADRLRTDTYFEETSVQGNRQTDKAKPSKFELYTEGYLQNILAPQDKNLVEQLKQINPDGLERYFNMWKERKYTDENIEGQFPGYAKKRIKEAQSTQV